MPRLRKVLVSAFIVLVITTQIFQNLSVGHVGDRLGSQGPLAFVGESADKVRSAIDTFAFYSSTNTYWRMFSPVHRYDWWWRVVATDPAGRERDLAVPVVKGSTTSSLLVDFRDAKMLLNLWTRPSMQAAYLDHRCLEEAAGGRATSMMRLELHWRDILPPEQAAVTGSHRATSVTTRVMAQRTCR